MSIKPLIRPTIAIVVGALLIWLMATVIDRADAAPPPSDDSVSVQTLPHPGYGKPPNKKLTLPGKKCKHAYNPYGGYMGSQCQAGFGGSKMTRRDAQIVKCINAILISGAAALGGGGATARSVYVTMGAAGASCALT